MVRTLPLVAYATAVAAQFNVKHTQYGTSPPVYPSPRTYGAGGWNAALKEAQAFVAELTTEEKAQMVTGKHRVLKDTSWLTIIHRYVGTMRW
jgi:beta-glucosidase